MKGEKILLVISATALTIFVVAWIGRGIYLVRVKNGEFRYSVAEMKKPFHKLGRNGKIVQYSLNGTIYEEECTARLCLDAEIGSRYFIKIFLKDPTVFEIFGEDVSILSIREAPREGWRTVPNTKYKKW